MNFIPATSHAFPNNGRIAFSVTVLVGLSTGALLPPQFEPGTGGSYNHYNVPDIERSKRGAMLSNKGTAAAADIDYVKTVLRLTTTELADYLGVSRQAIYGWRSGGHVKSHNITKLENLTAAASVIDRASSPLSALQIGRKLPGGRSMLETIAAGGDGYEAAQSLTNMLQREAEQRKVLNSRFAGRTPGKSEPGAGIAALREDG